MTSSTTPRSDRLLYAGPVATRRRFMTSTAAGLAAGLSSLPSWNAALQAQQQGNARHGKLLVTDIEVHNIMVPYEDWIHDTLDHFYGPSRRTIYVVRTNSDLIGLGESGGPESADVLNNYIGSSPWDWIGDETSLGLGTAMYDLMGKAAGIPVYKLFGQRFRRWVPVGSWTVSADPTHVAEAVQQYSRRGYTWLKYHLSPFENVIDQLQAMQNVAPRGFRLMFDLTMGGTNDHTYELLEKMSEFPITGAFEDPLYEKNIEAYRELRRRSRVPIVLHHAPLGHTFEILSRAADACILGHSRIGNTIRTAGLMAGANLPFMLQNVGGQITRSMTTHMQSAFKTASFQFHSDAETWKADVVKQRPDPVNGFLRVSEAPGLGVTIDPAELDRLKNLKLPERAKWIIKTEFANGTRMYNIADPKQSIFMVRPDYRKLIPMSYNSPLKTDWWDDDGTPEYRKMFERIEREGMVLTKG